MDTQLKQRLTGAVILVALAVLLVPEILSGPPPRQSAPARVAESGVQPAPSDTSPTNATDRGEMRSYTIDLTNESAPLATNTPTETALPVSAPANNSTTSAGEGRSAQPPEAAAAAPAEAPPAVASAADGAGAPVADPPRSGAFAVQVGSFGNRENADRLTRELQSKGFPAYVEDPDGAGRGLARVRVGPVATRDDASKLLEQLRAAGQGGAIVPNS